MSHGDHGPQTTELQALCVQTTNQRSNKITYTYINRTLEYVTMELIKKKLKISSEDTIYGKVEVIVSFKNQEILYLSIILHRIMLIVIPIYNPYINRKSLVQFHQTF